MEGPNSVHYQIWPLCIIISGSRILVFRLGGPESRGTELILTALQLGNKILRPHTKFLPGYTSPEILE